MMFIVPKTKTLKVRVKDKHVKQLKAMASSVNFVWNYINELSYRNICERRCFLSAYDIQHYTKGAGEELGIRAATLQIIGAEYVIRRKQHKKSKLNWRKTGGVRRSLGWIPFRGDCVKWKNGQVYHNGIYFDVWDSYGLEDYKFRSGSFNEDARGRWYFNVAVYIEPKQSTGIESVGIDLGCKETAVDSNGDRVGGREYRKFEVSISIAQRANKKERVRAIHAKVKNRRQDALHKYSRKLVDTNAAIFVGNISSKALIKTKMAKSVLDAGWGSFKRMLEYKSDHAGIIYEEINEAYTTQTCSVCKNRTGPKGLEGLGIREWTCSDCGATHDRDVNAAKSILALGHERLAVGISAFQSGDDVNVLNPLEREGCQCRTMY